MLPLQVDIAIVISPCAVSRPGRTHIVGVVQEIAGSLDTVVSAGELTPAEQQPAAESPSVQLQVRSAGTLNHALAESNCAFPCSAAAAVKAASLLPPPGSTLTGTSLTAPACKVCSWITCTVTAHLLCAQASAALADALQRCVAPDVFLAPLADRFVRLALQLVARYASWLAAGLAARTSPDEAPPPEQVGPAQRSDSHGGGPGMACQHGQPCACHSRHRTALVSRPASCSSWMARCGRC